MFLENIDSESVTALPEIHFSGKTIVISSTDDIEEAMTEFNNAKIIGFDTETKPTFKKGVVHGTALLQLATDSVALLVKIKEAGLPKPIIDLLENPNIIKVGAAIHDDIKGLKKVKNFNPQGFIDLQNIVPNFGIEVKSVRKIAAIVLGNKVSKNQQLSNWEALHFTPAQIDYAATDAWVCQKIYLKLLSTDPDKMQPCNIQKSH